MKLALLGIAAFVLSGCLTTAKMSREEACANQGMIVEGVTVHGVTKSGRTISSLNCKEADDTVAKCKLQQAEKITTARLEMDDNAFGKNILIGFGYMMYVVPGWALYEYWNDDHQVYVENYQTAATEYGKCSQKEIAH